ncbi:hypothetical protein ACFXDJ_27210 [Streptomyces sp. NPDC059443]|uniref:hypothetical protein n=1 Tax=unclassified Streptomyces TaxID=2593676 RepID=UPI00367EB3A4
MNQKSAQRCMEVAGPLFAPGEVAELIEVVQIGKVSAKRQLAATVAVGIASGGTVLVALKPKAYFLVLTDQRLFLIDNNNGRPGKHVVSAVPRTHISAGPLRKHFLTVSMEVRMTAPTPWRFSWGRVQSDMARRVAAALGAPGPAIPAQA